jgi:hypothetical protein
MTPGAYGHHRIGRRKLLVMLASASLVAGIVIPAAVLAVNTTLVGFEIDGNLPASADTGAIVDWTNSTNTGADSPTAALKCVNVANCTAVVSASGVVTNVVDGAGTGEGSLFRDDLKVDPDRTTFTQGDKENLFGTISTVPNSGGVLQSLVPFHIVSGSTPPNKDDLFDVATNTYILAATGQSELDLGMIRTNNNGSSHVDFELNRANWTAGGTGGTACATNGTGITGFQCPIRTEGDLLVSFEISPSSTTPPVSVNVRYFVWDLPGGTDANGHGRGDPDCQGPLTGNENTCPWEEIAAPATTVIVTAVNGITIPAGPWGSRLPNGNATTQIPPGGWFEAGLDLDALGFAPGCPGFGTASAKARSSGSSVTSALTDLAGPFPVDLNTCANLIVDKVTDPSGSTQSFPFTVTGPNSYSDAFSLTDAATPHDSGQIPAGTYVVTETPVPNGWTLTSATCSDGSPVTGVVLDPGETVTCTFNNRARGAISILKNSSKGGAVANAGAVFSIDGTTSVTDNGTGDEDADIGQVCVSGLLPGSHSVTETSPPPGYGGDGATHSATAVAGTDCTTNLPSGTGVATFTNPPLADIQVNFRDGGSGETSATITCDNTTGTGSDTAATGWDTSRTVTGVKAPTIIHCTIDIDP